MCTYTSIHMYVHTYIYAYICIGYLFSTSVLISMVVSSVIHKCTMRRHSPLKKTSQFQLMEPRVCLRVFNNSPLHLFDFLGQMCSPGPATTLSQCRDIQENSVSFKKELLISGISVSMQVILITHEICLVFRAVLVRYINRIFFLSTFLCYWMPLKVIWGIYFQESLIQINFST